MCSGIVGDCGTRGCGMGFRSRGATERWPIMPKKGLFPRFGALQFTDRMGSVGGRGGRQMKWTAVRARPPLSRLAVWAGHGWPSAKHRGQTRLVPSRLHLSHCYCHPSLLEHRCHPHHRQHCWVRTDKPTNTRFSPKWFSRSSTAPPSVSL